MKNFLESDEYFCWQSYVSAVSLFCSRAITKTGIELADKLIHKFCCLFKNLYGKEECTPNLHLHCHFSESILNLAQLQPFVFLVLKDLMEYLEVITIIGTQ